jgi:hypothetical protein
MDAPAIRPAGPGDMPALHRALCRLSDDLGDAHRADAAALDRACAGPAPAAYGFLAGPGPEGAALWA